MSWFKIISQIPIDISTKYNSDTYSYIGFARLSPVLLTSTKAVRDIVTMLD